MGLVGFSSFIPPSPSIMSPSFSVSPTCKVEPPSTNTIGSVLQRHFPPSVQIQEVYPLEGHLHSVSLLILSNGAQWLLKCPPRSTTPLLRREQLLLETEARALSILGQSATPYVPSFVHYGFQGGPFGSAFLVRHYVTGMTLKEMGPRLTTQERRKLDRDLGSLVQQIGQPLSNSFGSLEQVACGRGKLSWRDAFVVLFEDILRDSEDAFVHLPYSEIRHHVRRLSYALEEVTLPRLVVIGLGRPSQVFLDPASRKLSGVTGFGHALWGDIYMAEVFEDPSPAMLEGFGTRLTKSESQVTRQLLYACYRSVHNITIHYYRDKDMAAEMEARRRLTTTLAEMSAIKGAR